MANKGQNQETLLRIGGKSFTDLLEKQVTVGRALVNRPIRVIPNPMARNEKDYFVDDNALEVLRSDYSQWRDYNLEILKRAFTNNGGEYLEKYKNCGICLLYSTKNRVEQLKDLIKKEINELLSLIKRTELLELTNSNPNTEKKVDKIFVVYGHDRAMKLEVETFLRSQLKLEVVALDEMPNCNKTIIDKFEYYSEGCTFAVILMSPDDDVEVDGQFFKRARQNVVLELGYFMAKLGRERVCVLVSGNIEKPSDISGIIHLPFNSNWQFELLRELKAAGVAV